MTNTVPKVDLGSKERLYLFIESVEVHICVGIRCHLPILAVLLGLHDLILGTWQAAVAVKVSLAIVLVLLKSGHNFVNLKICKVIEFLDSFESILVITSNTRAEIGPNRK